MPFDIGGYIYNGGQADTQDYYNIITRGLVLNLDASAPSSYPTTGTSWTDISGNNLVGTLTNGPTFNSSDGGSIVFDGTDDYVNVPYNAVLDTPSGATYEIWFKPTVSTAGEFLSRGTSDSGATPDNPRFYVGSNGTIYFDWSRPGADTYSVSSTSVNMGSWNQVIGLAIPSTSLKIYINGSEVSYALQVQTLPATVPNTTDPITIGGATWIPRYFTGNIASVKLYNRALAAAEISQNFNVQRSRFGI